MTPYYPGAIQVPADPTNFREAWRESFSKIVIHCTDGHSYARPVADMWRQKNHGSSAHFVGDQDGTIIQTVQLKDIAWHAHAANASSIGIEHCARTPGELGPNDPGLPPSESLYLASARLVAWLLDLGGLPVSRSVVLGHAEADPQTTHKLCPLGCGWDWDLYMEMVNDALVLGVV